VHEVPGISVDAVEVSEEAARWAERNLSGTGVRLHVQDMAGALPELDGRVDLVIANPPYIPLEAYESVTPEVRDHDPLVALFSGDDGLDAMRVVTEVAARLLTDGGLVCAEHAEVQVDSAPRVFTADGRFSSVRDHRDLSGRPRFVTAVRRARAAHG
jgi:release factor glutamine methyltransferase